MDRIRACALALAFATVGTAGALFAGPVTPSYFAVEEAIAGVRSAWSNAQGDDIRRAEGWDAITQAVEQGLQDFTTASDEAGRQAALTRLSRLADALRVSAWPPAVQLRADLDSWLRPRMSLVEASRQLAESLRSLPAASSPEVAANRERWASLDQRLSEALRSYESSTDAADRAAALDELRSTLDLLNTAGRQQAWTPAITLQQALASLFERPNVEAIADLPSVTPFLSQPVVFSEILYYKGQTSYITPGVRTGFGLLPNNDGLSFYNSQLAHSVTPVRGFQEQVAADDRGRFLTKLYQLSATIYNTSDARVFITVQPRPGGISINPQPTNNIDAQIDSQKLPGHHPHITRSAISLVGFGQERIENEIYENGIGQIRQEAATSSLEVARYRAAEAQAKLNSQATQYLVGERRIEVGPIALANAELRSQPSFVGVRGKILDRGDSSQLGADFPLPATFGSPAAGVTADLHLPSALTNVLAGQFRSAEVQAVENLLVETRPADSDEPPLQTRQNVDFEAHLDAIRRAQELNNAGAQAMRVFRPGRPPEFTADRDGNLVAVIRDFKVDLPAPAAATRGGLAGPPARVYRIISPNASVTLTFKVIPGTLGGPIEVEANIVSFDPGRDAQVLAINEDENDARRLNALTSSVILGALRTQFIGRTIRQTIDPMDLQGFAVESVSDLHPTGWMRVILTRLR